MTMRIAEAAGHDDVLHAIMTSITLCNEMLSRLLKKCSYSVGVAKSSSKFARVFTPSRMFAVIAKIILQTSLMISNIPDSSHMFLLYRCG